MVSVVVVCNVNFYLNFSFMSDGTFVVVYFLKPHTCLSVSYIVSFPGIDESPKNPFLFLKITYADVFLKSRHGIKMAWM